MKDNYPVDGRGSGEMDLPAKQENALALRPAPPVPALRRELKASSLWGISLAIILFGVCGGWAATAPLAGAVIADGMVSPESQRQVVQHLEGGIIQKILVKEGDRVSAGDELLVLHDASVDARRGALRGRLIATAAQEARLKAEQENASVLEFDHPVLTDLNDPAVLEAIKQETRRFVARKETDTSQKKIIQQRIAQLKQQIAGMKRQLEGVQTQLTLTREESTTAEQMVAKGLERRPRLLSIKRTMAGYTANEGELLASIARAEESIAENELVIRNVDVERAETVESDLAAAQAARVEIEQELQGLEERLKRNVVRAPSTGTILNVRFKTTGGVVKHGDAVLDIVPTEDELLVDARIMPTDIDDVVEGASAFVMFPSYSQRSTLKVPGRVQRVSADAILDEKSGLWYFAAKVKIEPETMEDFAPMIRMTPGLPAQVFIATSERTVLDYLVQPLRQAMVRSFREH